MYTVNQLQEIINSEIKKISKSLTDEPVELYEPISYVLQNGGKRLRPVMLLLTCNLFSDVIEHAIPAAMAIEVFHNFTLIHDDIMDNADMRRNSPTIHKKWNTNIAILSGDAMSILAYRFLSKLEPSLLDKALPVFNRTALRICEGQQYDMNFETVNSITADDYMNMIGLKTGELLAASLQIGSITGKCKDEEAVSMYEFGKNLGIAFQIQDDLLDVYGKTEDFGKEIGGDIVSNKQTFLLVNAYELANEKQQNQLKYWNTLTEFDNKEKIRSITDILNELNIKELAENKIKQLYNVAFMNFDKINIAESRKTELRDLAEKLIIRNK